MKWRVLVEVTGNDGVVTRHVISEGERTEAGQAVTLGLSLAESKATLAGLQRVLVTAQTDAHCHRRRRCGHCGSLRPLKDHRPRRLVSLFGTVEVRAPRFGACRCGVACRRILTPVAEIMPDRCNTPAPAHGRQSADALVATWRSPNAEGPLRGDERYPCRGSRRRRAIRPPTISPCAVRAPRFATVSHWLYRASTHPEGGRGALPTQTPAPVQQPVSRPTPGPGRLMRRTAWPWV